MQLLQNLKILRNLLAFVVVASMALPKQVRAEVGKNQGVVDGTSITYTVQFNSNVSTGVSVSNMPSSSTVGVTYGTAVMPTATPTRNGCTFAGWNTEANGSGTNVTSGNFNTLTNVPNTVVNLYAQWTLDLESSYWEATLKPHDGGTRPIDGTYSYYPGGQTPLTTVTYDGIYDVASGLYYYATVGMAVEAAVAGPMTSDQAIDTSDPEKDILNPNIGELTDVVTLLKDVAYQIYNFSDDAHAPYSYGISKGIVVDLQGHESGGISSGQIPDDQVLVITNNSERVNVFSNPDEESWHGYIRTGYGEVDDEGGPGYKTGTVILNNVTTNSIWGSLHLYIILSGNYNNISKDDSEFDLDVRGGCFTEDPRNMPGINVSLTNSHVVRGNEEPVHADIYKNYIVLKGATAYTVNFDANAGDAIVTGMPEPSSLEVVYGSTSMPENNPTRVGYNFVEWNTKANGRGITVTEENFNTFTSEYNGNVTLYAQWVSTAKVNVPNLPGGGTENSYTYFTSLEDAVEAAPDGSTVTLLRDHYEISETINVSGKSITLRSDDYLTVGRDDNFAMFSIANGAGMNVEDITLHGGWETGCAFDFAGASLVLGGKTTVEGFVSETGAINVGEGATLTVGGNTRVSNNTNSEGKQCNIFIQNGTLLTIDTPQENMHVGITMENGLGWFSTNGEESFVNHFFADIDPEGEEVVVTCPDNYLALHVHGNWHFTGEGNVINATCRNDGCSATPYTRTSIILNAANKVYDGERYTATYEIVGPEPESIGEIVYYNRNNLDTPIEAPINMGYYTAMLTVTCSGDDNIATAVKDFDIAASYSMEPDDYYLYNTESKKWFGAGNEDGFQASLKEAPEFVRIENMKAALTAYEDATSSTGYLPMYGSWADAYTRSQYVVPATNLEKIAGSTINSLTYYATGSYNNISWTSTFKVYLKEVDFTTMTGFIDPNDATEVYRGLLRVANRTMTVEFDTPFEYHGGNLLIGMDCIEKGGNYSNCYFCATPATGAGRYQYNSSSYQFGSGTQVNYIPTTTFGYTADGVYAIKSYIDEDGKYFNGREISSTNPGPLYFWKAIDSEGAIIPETYTITSTNDDVYGYDGTTVLSQNAEGENSHWKIYTKADLINGLSDADLTHPKDATFLILDPGFGRSSSWLSEWNGEPSNVGSHNDMHASMEGGKFNVYQDLELNLDDDEEIPNGIYELSVQGFYSSTSDKRCAYFYANNEAMALKNIASIAQQPTTEEAASAAFTAGKYQCSTLRFVVTNHKIRIGVKGVYEECGWTAFDNFRLMYLGPTSQSNH